MRKRAHKEDVGAHLCVGSVQHREVRWEFKTAAQSSRARGATEAKVKPTGADGMDNVTFPEWMPCCPISLSVPEYPVVASDGKTYELENILKVLRGNGISPVTREAITAVMPIPTELRGAMDAAISQARIPATKRRRFTRSTNEQ